VISKWESHVLLSPRKNSDSNLWGAEGFQNSPSCLQITVSSRTYNTTTILRTVHKMTGCQKLGCQMTCIVDVPYRDGLEYCVREAQRKEHIGCRSLCYDYVRFKKQFRLPKSSPSIQARPRICLPLGSLLSLTLLPAVRTLYTKALTPGISSWSSSIRMA
jgi:hypothetical protein